MEKVNGRRIRKRAITREWYAPLVGAQNLGGGNGPPPRVGSRECRRRRITEMGLSRAGRHLVRLEVIGRPAVFATAAEADWKATVRQAVAESGITPPSGRFRVRMIFRTPMPKNANEKWDIDNLVKPTLDAMEGVFGLRQWQGRPQPADDRVDRIEAEKRQVAADEHPGATIDIWVVDEGAPAPEPVNIDADPVNADWIRVLIRMDEIRAQHPDLSDADVRRRAEREHLASIRTSNPRAR